MYGDRQQHLPHPVDVPQHIKVRLIRLQPLRQWTAPLALVGLVTLFGMLIYPVTNYTNLVMFYLLGVVVAAIRYGKVAAMFTVILSVLAFNIGFIPPRFTIHVSDAQNLLTFAILAGVGIVIADIAARARDHARQAQQRERYTSALYSLSRDLSATDDLQAILRITQQHVSQTFRCETAFLLQNDGKLAQSLSTPDFDLTPDERNLAEWVFVNGLSAGQGTSRSPEAAARFSPLMTAQRTVGVLVVRLKDPAAFTTESFHLLEAFSSHAALGIDAFFLSKEAQQAQLLQEVERLQSALLNSISHDLRTPLVSITGALSSLSEQADYLNEAARKELIQGAWEEAQRLNRLVGNLLDMTRLEADAIKLKQRPSDLSEIIGVAVSQLHLFNRDLQIDVSPTLPMVNVDFVLIVQVLSNLLENACKYSPEDSPIAITASRNGIVTVSVSDQGMGIKKKDMPYIFQKFFRSDDAQGINGSGLGLSICRGIIGAHGGRIWADSSPGKGTTFSFTLPIEP